MAGKKYYEIEKTVKRVHLTLEPETQRKIRTIQMMLGKSEDDVVSIAIDALFRENVAKHAEDQGLLLKSPNLSLDRQSFEDSENCEGMFDSLCEQLNLNGSDGNISSIQGICIEVKKSWVEK